MDTNFDKPKSALATVGSCAERAVALTYLMLCEIRKAAVTRSALYLVLLGAIAVALMPNPLIGDSSVHTSGTKPNHEGTRIRRPPQFVALAFDNCNENSVWQATLQFCRDMEKRHVHVRFTYFLSGIALLTDSNSTKYQGPSHEPGDSKIDFGGNAQDVVTRIRYIRAAYEEGHEIACHACGHFDAEREGWTQDQWASELESFFGLLVNVKKNSGLSSPVSLGFSRNEIRGFRAPNLGCTPGLLPALRNARFKYDTSRTEDANYWPTKQVGIWNFPLAVLHIAGTGAPTLSMDYNFYNADSHALPDTAPERLEVYRQRMLQTYLDYFQTNYDGNRAPIHIGHHFSQYNGGTYWKAMQDFVRAVAERPEVKFVTYSELANYMDHLSTATIARYQAGDFVQPAEVHGAAAIAAAPPHEYLRKQLRHAGVVEDPPEAETPQSRH